MSIIDGFELDELRARSERLTKAEAEIERLKTQVLRQATAPIHAEVEAKERDAFFAGYKAGGEHAHYALHDVNTAYTAADALDKWKSDETSSST